MENEPNTLVCFTDGSCINNGKKNASAAYANVWPFDPEYDCAFVLKGSVHTNNRAEFTALIHALDTAMKMDPGGGKTLVVYTDSMLLVNTITIWMSNWKKNGWVKSNGEYVINLDLVKVLDEMKTKRKLVLIHVKAHTGKKDWVSINNSKVDILARAKSMEALLKN
jgi:ribonuclease HI